MGIKDHADSEETSINPRKFPAGCTRQCRFRQYKRSLACETSPRSVGLGLYKVHRKWLKHHWEMASA